LSSRNVSGGHVRCCIYGRGINNKEVHLHDEDTHMMTVHRTSWMDTSLGRFKNQTILLPLDLSTEYKQHIMAPVRIYENDSMGNPVGRYVTGSEDDHFAHARTYCEMAFALATSIGQSQDAGLVL